MMKDRYWYIRGMSGLNQFSELMIPQGHLTSKKLDELLQALVAKYGLSDEEITSCFYRKRCKAYCSLLEIRYDRQNQTRECGEDPYFVASLVDSAGKTIPMPKLKSAH
ncbi:hypothetical protein [Neptunomonas concharum]|uniref:Uncharacterized protein n=1 Tax=Neptunomonas concharum TaxID=1031538 RepID=A0A5P1RAF8_9GAMM|nr:hypothetical protein [Neptunomonas concharum]QEQ96272.1 hypothetical protein F0U83_05875 [Neptunomonas concharum]